MPTDNTVIRLADWEHDKNDLRHIRRAVFIDEQNVAEQLEWDEYDTVCTHFIVLLDDSAIATARLKADGQLGRMAVLKEHRHRGIGDRMLRYVLQYAAGKNLQQLYLHAQLTAIAFYEKQGFIAHGPVFYEAGIAHRAMTKSIS